jgi:putative transposase
MEKATTNPVRDCDVVAIEDLRVKNMTKAAKGTIEDPGKNVAHKRDPEPVLVPI